ncbi:hypothetical protein ACYQR9_19065 [Methylobacterium sp. CM6241]
MMGSEVKQLFGAVKITRIADSIGLPVFMSPLSNAMYIPEMDADFNIKDFLLFPNRERFIIDHQLPPAATKIKYREGDPAPLPYWLEGNCFIISGDAQVTDLISHHGDQVDAVEVLRDLSQILADARGGVYRRESEVWVARDIAATFSDIFHETPVHSRYWVGRFTQAVEHARKLAKPPHPIDGELRRVGMDWVNRFATKTDLARFKGITGSLIEGILSDKQISGMFFAFIMHRIHSGSFSSIERDITVSNEFSALFPYGLYGYYRENGWPDVSFSYGTPFRILDPFYRELAGAENKGEFKRLERLAYAYFRNADAPREIGDAITPVLHRMTDLFMDIKRTMDGRSTYSHMRSEYYTSDDLVQIYRNMMNLDGVMNGSVRLSETVIDRRFGLDSRFIVDLMEDIYKNKRR